MPKPESLDGASALVVVATAPEFHQAGSALGNPVATPLPGLRRYRYRERLIDVLTTGVGMVATATWTAAALARSSYEVAFNFGVCGSFDPSLAPGQVVHIVRDQLAELGAEDGDAFLSLGDLRLAGADRFINDDPPGNAALAALPRVSAITVNTVHGNERTIAAVVARCQPQVESMEGAAFMYVCASLGVAHAQVRAVSNRVERRNRPAWKLPESIAALNIAALEIINTL